MIDAFHDYLDGLYYEGYASELLNLNPEGYRYELQQFLEAYAVKVEEQ